MVGNFNKQKTGSDQTRPCSHRTTKLTQRHPSVGSASYPSFGGVTITRYLVLYGCSPLGCPPHPSGEYFLTHLCSYARRRSTLKGTMSDRRILQKTSQGHRPCGSVAVRKVAYLSLCHAEGRFLPRSISTGLCQRPFGRENRAPSG